MRRLIKILLFLALPLVPLVLLGLALEGAPALPASATVEAGDAARARAALSRLRFVLDPGFRHNRYAVNEAEMNSVLALAERGLPSLRGRARVTPRRVELLLSVRLPTGVSEAWLNLGITLRPAPGPLQVEALRLGRLQLPARLVMPMARLGLNAVLDDRLGDTALAGVTDLAVAGRSVQARVELSTEVREALLTRSKQVAATFAPVGEPDRVRLHYRSLVEAAEAGRLPGRGSLTPYLRFALVLADRRAAKAESPGAALAEARAAVLALAVYCGHWRAQYLVGEMITGGLAPLGSRCGGVTLAGRGDLRQHFTISAALEVASNSGAAFSVGEFKELLDSTPRGSGFSFDDLAADRAGIRFAGRLLKAAPVPAERGALIASLASERAVFPDIAGLPDGMSDADFKREFDDVDSPRYRQLVALIDRRIDRLAFYAR